MVKISFRFGSKAKETQRYIQRIVKRLTPSLVNAVNKISDNMTTYVKANYLSHKSDSSIGIDTGEIYNSTIPIHVSKRQIKNLRGGVAIGTSAKAQKYVNVHVSDRPKITVIRSKNKLLTIPLPNAKRRRYKSVWDVKDSKVKKLKRGKYKGGYVVGSQKGRGKSFTPYYLLADQVSIKSRVHTDEIANRYSPVVTRILNSEISRVLRK